jgi:hypothetical protein
VVDAYYASQKIIRPLLRLGSHVITRMRTTAVAYHPMLPSRKRARGRPRKYGKKVRLLSLFDTISDWVTDESPVYGEKGVKIRYAIVDLVWRPLGELVRFVLVDHPTRGKIVLLSSDVTLDALTVIRLYGLRAKIECGFKQALHVLGVYAYHFWMKAMDKVTKGQGDQHLHWKSDEYRDQVRRKLGAYEIHIQLGLIAQGLLQYLAVSYSRRIWESFGSWLRR